MPQKLNLVECCECHSVINSSVSVVLACSIKQLVQILGRSDDEAGQHGVGCFCLPDINVLQHLRE